MILPHDAFDSPEAFEEHFSGNLRTFLENTGAVRVPDDAAWFGSGVGDTSTELTLPSDRHEGRLATLGARLFRVEVPAEGIEGSALRIDLRGKALKLRVKREAPPSRFTSRTASAKRVGSDVLHLRLDVGSRVPLKPGTWFLSLTAAAGTEYAIGVQLGPATDAAASALAQPISVRTVRVAAEDEDSGGEWELVDQPEAPPEARPRPSGDGAPAVLTQGSDLLAMEPGLLRWQISLRGGSSPDYADPELLAAILFPLLPAAPLAAPRAGGGARQNSDPVAFAAADSDGDEDDAPASLTCPILCTVFEDPVFTADGMTYERAGIEQWLSTSRKSPMTNVPLPHTKLVPNLAMRRMVKAWRRASEPA